MQKSEFFGRTAIRLAIRYSIVFVITLIVTSSFSYYLISNYLYERLDRHVLERFTEIKNTLGEKGVASAVKMIKDHSPQIRGEETLYILQNSGTVFYTNTNTIDIPLGLSTLVISVDGAPSTPFRIRRESLSEFDLTVGVNYDDTSRLLKIEFATFLASTVIILITSFGSAYFSSKYTQKRIAQLTSRMNEIAKGRLATRLPVSRRKDDIDALAHGMNGALDKLQVSVEAIKRMSANAAHDLKAPISRVRLAIEANIQLLSNVPTVAHSLNDAIEQLDDLANTFWAMLKIAEIESGSKRHSFHPVNLADLAGDVFEMYLPIFEDAGRVIKIKSNESTYILGDYDLLRQLLINVVNNSLQHAADGSHVTIITETRDEKSLLIVSDNGPGIPATDRDRVFEQFVHLSPQGTGLGLSIVKAVTEIHGAKISLADNNPGLIVTIAFQKYC